MQSVRNLLEVVMVSIKKTTSFIILLLLTAGFCSAGSYKKIENVDRTYESLPLKYSIGLRYGAPTTKQILPINTKEFYFQRRLRTPTHTLIVPAMEVSVSQLNVGDEKGYVYGFGPMINIPIGGSKDKLYFTMQAKVHYMTRHDFGRKRYGGPLQWTYAFGVKTDLTINTFASYTWMHMSNGDVYEHNPALETHRITVGIHF